VISTLLLLLAAWEVPPAAHGVPDTPVRVPSVDAARGSPRGRPAPADSRWRVPFAVPGRQEAGQSHDTHVSHTRLVLEGRAIALRVRLFHDDLTIALQRATGRPELRITAESREDSAFGSYFGRQVKLEVDGRSVALRVTGSGTERDAAAQEVVWYVLEGGLERPASRIVVLNGLLFEIFADQQNILQLLRLPDDQRRTLYFTASDPRAQRLEF
jgi:hypothetical protein